MNSKAHQLSENQQLDVKSEAVEGLAGENRFDGVFSKSLEAALSVLDAGNAEDLNETVETST
ncbi:MAG: hypothetical protein U1E10_00870 [Bdellovibrionales bacterium]|nr:hypothetical protein [Bdellovibrionales bacterium]